MDTLSTMQTDSHQPDLHTTERIHILPRHESKFMQNGRLQTMKPPTFPKSRQDRQRGSREAAQRVLRVVSERLAVFGSTNAPPQSDRSMDPHSSFEDGQTRVPYPIPRRHDEQSTLNPKSPPAIPAMADYALPSLYYPVIRTDYSNDTVYAQIRHVLLNSSYFGDPVSIDMTFYDGTEPPSPSPSILFRATEEEPSLAKEDPRGSDYQWYKTHFENKSVNDLKASFGELGFRRKDRVPIYSFGGHGFAIVVDSQSMKDGTVKFLETISFDFVNTRPDHGPGREAGAWEEDAKKEW
ncbi:unnamed protein product [Calypogeia fissa]